MKEIKASWYGDNLSFIRQLREAATSRQQGSIRDLYTSVLELCREAADIIELKNRYIRSIESELRWYETACENYKKLLEKKENV